MDFSKNIKILKGETEWPMWKRKIRDLLDYHEGTLDVIDRKLHKPTPLESTATAEEKKLYQEQSGLYRKANSYAKSVLCSSISDEIYQKVMDKESAADVWDALKNLFEATAKDQLFKVCADFFSFVWDDNQDVTMHIAKLKGLWLEFNNGLKEKNLNELPDLLLVGKVLHILPSKFDTFKSSWMMLSKNEEKTFEELCMQITMYQRNFGKGNTTSTEEALIAKTKFKKSENSNKFNRKNSDVCNYCKKKGHWVRDCRKWAADGKPSKEANEAKAVSQKCLPVFCEEANVVQDADTTCWWIDNGATRHITNSKDNFKDFKSFSSPNFIRAAGKEVLQAIGKGTIEIESKVKNKTERLCLTDVWYVPNITRNLFSVLSAQDKQPNSRFISTATNCKLFVDDEIVLCGSRSVGGTLYKANIKAIKQYGMEEVNEVQDSDLLQLYHERWGHQDKRHIQKMLKLEMGISIKDDKTVCEPCIYGKAHRLPFGHRNKATSPGELVTADVCGPFSESFSKKKYLVIFKDSYTKYRFGFVVKQKSEVKDCLEEVLMLANNRGHHIKELLSDNGGEFDNHEIKSILKKNGVMQRLTAPYTPQQNCASERENRTVVEMARTFKYSNAEAKFPDAIWAELVRTSIYVLNRTGKSSVENKSPYELWMGKKPRVHHLRIISCECYVHIPKQKRKKMDAKATKGFLIGYDDDERYRVYIKEKQEVIISRDVKFIEKIKTCVSDDQNTKEDNNKNLDTEENNEVKFKFEEYRSQNADNKDNEDHELIDEDQQNEELIEEEQHSDEELYDDALEDDLDEIVISDDDVQEVIPDRRLRGKRTRDADYDDNSDLILSKRLRDRTLISNPKYDDFVMEIQDFINKIETPMNYKEAINAKESKQWIKAMDSEINSLKENNTWELADLPKGAKALPSRWVFRVKMNPDGTIEKFKARLVIKGFTQREGIDYNETFSPVARLATIRVVLSIAASNNMHLFQFDVATAFLYGELEEEMFMKKPEGYSDGTKRVCKLKRSLYGLKQAPRCWNKRLVKYLLKIGFNVCEADPCLFIRIKNGKKLILVLYVDDGLVAGTDEIEVQNLLQELRAEFKITSKEANYFLGLEIKKENGAIRISQTAYVKKILERFNFDECRPVSTPMTKIVEDSETGKAEDLSKFPYRQAVGGIMYLMLGTRPDLAYSIGYLSRTLDNPSKEDIVRVKRVFRYIAGTKEYGITYTADNNLKFECYSDADFGGCLKTGRSTSGIIIKYAGAVILWMSQRQPIVATSTTEAEIVAATEATKEIIWLKRLYSELIGYKDVPVLQVDNNAAIRLAQNPEFHRRTKHIALKHFFIREKVSENEICVTRISTEDQLADLMTNPLQATRLKYLISNLGLSNVNKLS